MENQASPENKLFNNETSRSSDQPGRDFDPPRHWVGPEELQASYWSDPEVQERRGQEFHDKPIETLAAIERVDRAGMARRDFLTLMGASMAMASFACARRPVQKIIPYVVKPEEITPGVANWYATTCPQTAYGVLVKTREGRPIKLEGNPDHPVNQGALSARGQAAVLDLYDPDRLTEPVQRSRGTGGNRPVSWEEADKAIQAKLKSAKRVRVLSGVTWSPSTRRLISEFLSAFSSGEHVQYDAIFPDELPKAQQLSYGAAVIPTYHFDRAERVVSLGADFMGSGPSSVEHTAGWSKQRKLSSEHPSQSKMSKLICFEPTMSLTGANADERYPVRPGDELKIALALAHEIIVARGLSRFAGDSRVTAVLGPYKPETVAAAMAKDTGVDVARLKKLARELWDHRGKSLVIAGSLQSKTEYAHALQIAANLLNSALENEGATVDGTLSALPVSEMGFSSVQKLISEMNSGAVDVLVLHRANPAYLLPPDAGFVAAMNKVPLVVSISDRVDETGMLSDYILPDHHFLENWGDAQIRRHLYSVQQPAIAPIHKSRGLQDTLLSWARGAGLKVSGLAARMASAQESNTWHDYLMAQWRETVFRDYGVSGAFERFWEEVLRKGVFDGLAARGESRSRPTARPFNANAMTMVPPYKAAPEGVQLALYAKVSLHDGAQANNAWLQEMPDPISTVTWDNYLNVSPSLAKKLGLEKNDIVEITVGDQSLSLPVHIQPGMHPSVVSAAVGYGRRSVGKVGDGAGVDVYPLVAVSRISGGASGLVYSGQGVKIRKTGRFYQLAITQWHHVTENRPIINDITLAEFKKDPQAANHTDPHLRMETVPTIWPEFKYKGHRWGMAIDLNSCTGCGACVIGCQAENNIPVVGRNNVRVSREMHWIRIDRYYSGSPEQPDVVFQPMLCQHCENAPCETVCPVLATVHSDEGLNEQVYNRCVGTRYCQNNCPYKVRRFNFFDHWKSYDGVMNLVWNPDVTVRTRGIMEKCTFCVQRIRDAKDEAKDKGVPLEDGRLRTACQQTCPTDAIVFGDINDPKTRVSQLRADARAYRALEIVNTKPAVSYLTKVRNKEADRSEHPTGHKPVSGHGVQKKEGGANAHL